MGFLSLVAHGTGSWHAAGSTSSHRQRLARPVPRAALGLPLSVTLDVTGLGAVLFCHATARDDTEIVLVDSRLDKFRDAFAGTAEPTVVLGHTHMPFDRLADCRRFINPGSAGMPYGGTGAYWALLGPDVTLRRTGYDAEAAGETFRSAAPGYPDLAEFIAENMLTVPSDALALAAFSGTPAELPRARLGFRGAGRASAGQAGARSWRGLANVHR